MQQIDREIVLDHPWGSAWWSQTGEDDSDEDFFEGAKFMAIKILEHEARIHNVKIDYEKPKCDEMCSKWPDDCDDKCGKYFCNECCDLDYETGEEINVCKCKCGKKRKRSCDCECYCQDDTYDDDCDCEECDCAERKRKETSFYETYQKYQVWESKYPVDLVKELAGKIVHIREEGGREELDHPPFEIGQRLEAINPTQVNSICTATIKKVLEKGYLMIGFDPCDDQEPHDDSYYRYHWTSARIQYPGFCTEYNRPLTDAVGEEVEWDDDDYLPYELVERIKNRNRCQ